MQTYLVLVNPGAGSVDDDVEEAEDASWRRDPDLVAVHDELAQHGDVEVALVDGDEEVRAAVEGADTDTVLVVVGGDGTLHRFVNLLDGIPTRSCCCPVGPATTSPAVSACPRTWSRPPRWRGRVWSGRWT